MTKSGLNYSLMLRLSSVILVLWFLYGGGFGGMINVAVADDPSASYCSPDKYFKGDHQLKASIRGLLHDLLDQTTASGDSAIETKLQYPTESPLVYGAAFCDKSPPEDCGHCLRVAKKQLLHGCDHTAGAEYYSEICYLRFEIYNFFS